MIKKFNNNNSEIDFKVKIPGASILRTLLIIPMNLSLNLTPAELIAFLLNELNSMSDSENRYWYEMG